MDGGEHPLQILGPLLIRLGNEGVLMIWRKRMNQLLNELMNDKGV